MVGITNKLSIKQLYDNHKNKLEMEWIAGQQGAKHTISRELDTKEDKAGNKKDKKETDAKNLSLVGHLNLIHPNQIQIIGDVEIKYLNGLRDISMEDAVVKLFQSRPACIVVADDCTPPTFLKRKCNEHSVPLFKSKTQSEKVAEELHYFLTYLFADVLSLHGVYMEVMTIGLLIKGASGIGKSELALELISRGHRLVADDAPIFSKIAPDIINGTCPSALQDFLEVRGLGIINVRELFGDSAIKNNKYLKLIVQLKPMNINKQPLIDRLENIYNTCNIFDINIPEITIPVAPGRNLAVMIECAARNHILRKNGYNASEVFANRQKKIIKSKQI